MTDPDHWPAGGSILVLQREEEVGGGTFGTLRHGPSGIRLATVERPGGGNLPGVHRAPSGLYRVRPRRFFRGGYDAAEVVGVPHRGPILFHVANWPDDVEGCIGPGIDRGELRKPGAEAATPAVRSSGRAFRLLMTWLRSRWSTGVATWVHIRDPEQAARVCDLAAKPAEKE